MKKILILLLLIANVLNAQDEQKIFESANEMYKQQNYEKAIEYYNEDWSYVPGRLNLGVAHMLRADAA